MSDTLGLLVYFSAVENDFPSYGAGNLFADTLELYEQPLCFDIGHLWASAHVMGRDFYSEMENLLATGRVVMVHFHASIYGPKTPKADFGDGHQPLSTPTSMDLPRIAKTCYKSGVRHFVLEIPELTDGDVTVLADLLKLP